MKYIGKYKIIGFYENCSKNFLTKLLSIGFLPGVFFYILRFAPFGDPIEIKIYNSYFFLRLKELNLLKLEKQK